MGKQKECIHTMRSYQILTIIGSLFIIYDLIFAAHGLSLSVLIVNVLAIVSMFVFKNNTKAIGIRLIVLDIVMFQRIGNFGILRFRTVEMALFITGAITALRYKN